MFHLPQASFNILEVQFMNLRTQTYPLSEIMGFSVQFWFSPWRTPNQTVRTILSGSGSGSEISLNWTISPVQGSGKTTHEPDQTEPQHPYKTSIWLRMRKSSTNFWPHLNPCRWLLEAYRLAEKLIMCNLPCRWRLTYGSEKSCCSCDPGCAASLYQCIQLTTSKMGHFPG